MGRAGSGVEIRGESIRVKFTRDGKQERHTLRINGAPLAATPANIRYAERLAAEIREKIRLGLYSPAEYFPASGETGGAATVGDVLESWLAAQRIEASTRSGYASACTFWLSSLGERPARAIRHSDVLRAISARPELSGKTINNYVSVLRKAYDLAVRDGIVRESPVEGVPRAKWQREPPDPFDAGEIDAILGHAGAHYPEAVSNLLEFWSWTGLRTSELFALRWSSVDLRKRTVTIREANVRGVVKATTKTAVSREVALNSRALGAIQRQRALSGFSELVFFDPRYDEPWADERALRRSYWTPALRALGIRYRRPYNLRHSYATAMLMAGMTPAFCARQLGHSIEMFLRTYARWIDGDRNEAEMARLEASISPRLAQKQNKAS